MKGKKNLLNQLKNLPYFDKKTIFQLGTGLGLTEATIDTYISRLLKFKELIRLKNGLYVAGEFFNNNKNDSSYPFYLANILRKPSYVSSWTALQYYNLTTEVIHSVISVTPKVTREYQTNAGTFSYQSVKKELFTGFSLVKGTFDFFLAKPSKALFDTLYFRTRQFRAAPFKRRGENSVDRETVKTYLDELRIDFDEMDENEQSAFYSMIHKHV